MNYRTGLETALREMFPALTTSSEGEAPSAADDVWSRRDAITRGVSLARLQPPPCVWERYPADEEAEPAEPDNSLDAFLEQMRQAWDSGQQPVMLEPRQLDTLQRMLDVSEATPLQVAYVKAASIGTVVLIVSIAYIIVLVILRYTFNRWFDPDIYNQTWPSVAVVCTMIFVLGLILYAAVRG